MRNTYRQEVQLYKGNEADAFLQDKVADEMAKEVAQGVLEEKRGKPDRDYNACFQQWLLGKSDVLNNPLVTQRGYTSYIERFPRVVNWVDAQIRLASEIKIYLVRLYNEGPATEEEVEHEFRYLVWPLNNALTILQQARNDPSLGVDVLKGVPGGEWDPQHQTAGGLPWPAELTFMGRVPDSNRTDVPPSLHPALNPYMRDHWVHSVSYKEWLANDYSKLRGDARELWEVVANRTFSRTDRMTKPAVDDNDPQQQGEWALGGRPANDGRWDTAAPRAAKACGPRPMPANQKPLVAPDRPWMPAAPVPSAPEVGEEEQPPLPPENTDIAVQDLMDAVAEADAVGGEAAASGVKSEPTDVLADIAGQFTEALTLMRSILANQQQHATSPSSEADLPPVATREETPEAAPSSADDLDVSGAEKALEKAREEAAERSRRRQEMFENIMGLVARGVGNVASGVASAAGSAAASAISSLMAPPAAEEEAAVSSEPPSMWSDDTPVNEPAAAAPRATRMNADKYAVIEGNAFVARGRKRSNDGKK